MSFLTPSSMTCFQDLSFQVLRVQTPATEEFQLWKDLQRCLSQSRELFTVDAFQTSG